MESTPRSLFPIPLNRKAKNSYFWNSHEILDPANLFDTPTIPLELSLPYIAKYSSVSRKKHLKGPSSARRKEKSFLYASFYVQDQIFIISSFKFIISSFKVDTLGFQFIVSFF